MASVIALKAYGSGSDDNDSEEDSQFLSHLKPLNKDAVAIVAAPDVIPNVILFNFES